MRTIVVVEHDPAWPAQFESLRSRIHPAVSDIAAAIEHVGSTSVPGLAAKPIIDMVIVVPEAARIPEAIDRLAPLGYGHRGDLGVEGREAFSRPDDLPPHHLYLCPHGNLSLRNHLTLRDHLRAHEADARAYGALKKRLAREFTHDIDSYMDGKTDFIVGILRDHGFTPEQIEAIEKVNRKPD